MNPPVTGGVLEAAAVVRTDPRLPEPRGRLSEQLLRRLGRSPGGSCSWAQPESDEDAQLSLYTCYELHYRGFAGVDPAWEWDPDLLGMRARLESSFTRALEREVGRPAQGSMSPAEVRDELVALASADGGPSLSSFMRDEGTLAQFREFAVHRSLYQLKEADPHTWAIPRLAGAPKSALVDIQIGEYGDGVRGRDHATLFGDTMAAIGLTPAYGEYLDVVPATTIATVNLVSMLGLHRRWRGALVGHLALFEMTSVGPMGRYSDALGRLDIGPSGRRFYDEHVIADERHQHVALHDMAVALATREPALAGDIVFGARAVAAVEGRFSTALLEAWADGRSSLRATT